MKVLFVSSGNRSDKISVIVKNQGDSLVAKGLHLDYYLIKGIGVKGYLSNIIPLRRAIKNKSYDIIHAHYLFSAIVASLTFEKPVIVSLMGSEVSKGDFNLFLIKLFNRLFWSGCIVKTDQMKTTINAQNIKVMANGVDLERFRPLDKSFCQRKLNWSSGKKHILFASWPERPEKNYGLAKYAVNLMPVKNLELHYIKEILNSELVYYYNAADVVLLTSIREGSPNVIKEAMACNRPIVSTDVGDVKLIFGDTKGCFITSSEPENVAGMIKDALTFGEKTNGRDRIIELEMDSDSVAKRIIQVYNELITAKKNKG